MPLTVAGANTIIVLICLLWLLSGDYTNKFKYIAQSRIMMASISFYALHILGMFWTEDLNWGFHMLHKMWYFLLLFPILFNITKISDIRYYLISFLISIALIEVVSYLIWFEIIEPFKYATLDNPTPFMSHVSYNPILTFAIYLVLHQVFFNKKLSSLSFCLYSLFSISMIFNMFITGGRAGQVMFFAMLVILIFQFFTGNKVKSLLAVLIIIPGIFITSYLSSSLFEQRVNLAISDIMTYSDNQQTSVGYRVAFAFNSIEMIAENPIFGVGTGDFPSAYKNINKANTPHLYNTTNPHNMYLLVMSQLGVIGLISFLLIFYYQIKFSLSVPNKFIKDVGVTLPLLFLVVMLGDSYLLGHYTTLMFVFFSSFLYKNPEKNK